MMENGRFGVHGGQYIPETLMSEIHALEAQYRESMADPEFTGELDALLRDCAGRPSLLYHARRMSEEPGGARIYLKREDLTPARTRSTTCLGRRCWQNVWVKPA